MSSLQYLHVPKKSQTSQKSPAPQPCVVLHLCHGLTSSPHDRPHWFTCSSQFPLCHCHRRWQSGINVRYYNSIKRRLSIVKDRSVKIPIGNSSCVKGGSNCWSFLGGLNGIGLNGCGCNFMVFNGNFVIFRYDFSNSKNFKLASLFLSSCFHLGIMYPGPGLWLLSQVLLLVRDAK